MDRPSDMFDRDREWQHLEDFVTSPKPGATLGLVYGRRRQGKTFLLETLASVHDGFYFAALKQSSAQNLERLAPKYQAFTRSRAPVAFGSWEQALEVLLALGEHSQQPVVVVIDEFPYLLDGAEELPSLLQVLLSPRGPAARGWRTRLILCGSALTTMRDLLGGTAALRGRTAMELMVHPFDYRHAATFWGVGHDPDLAMQLHALVGGTAAYLDMCNQTRPASLAELDAWVARYLLDPASAMFREGNVLLSEGPHVTDTAVYFSVLAAISAGRTRRGEIAAAVGRSEGALTHPLNVLVAADLVDARSDAVKQKRTTFSIAEPVLRLHQLVIAPNEERLTRHHGARVWAEVADTVSSRIYGPHFEQLARIWCAEHASTGTLGGAASRVASTQIACREHKAGHEADVVVTEVRPNHEDRIIAIGEAKWRATPCGIEHLERLEHLRDLLHADSAVKLLVFSRSGFTSAFTEAAAPRSDVELIDVERLYSGD